MVTRRKFVAALLTSSTVAGSGCLETPAGIFHESDTLRTTFSGNVHTREPLTENAELSTADSYPYHYWELVTTEAEESENIRWEYIQDEIPLLEGNLEGTEFGSEFLLFFGMVLPRTRQLQPESTTTIEDDTLYAGYRIDRASSNSSEVAVNTAIKRIKHEDPPGNVAVDVRFCDPGENKQVGC